MKSTRRVLGHSLVFLLVRSHHSLIRFLLHCSLCSRVPLRLFICLLAHSLAPELMGIRFLSMNWMCGFHSVSNHRVLLRSTDWVDRPTNQTNQGLAARQVDDSTVSQSDRGLDRWTYRQTILSRFKHALQIIIYFPLRLLYHLIWQSSSSFCSLCIVCGKMWFPPLRRELNVDMIWSKFDQNQPRGSWDKSKYMRRTTVSI